MLAKSNYSNLYVITHSFGFDDERGKSTQFNISNVRVEVYWRINTISSSLRVVRASI